MLPVGDVKTRGRRCRRFTAGAAAVGVAAKLDVAAANTAAVVQLASRRLSADKAA